MIVLMIIADYVMMISGNYVHDNDQNSDKNNDHINDQTKDYDVISTYYHDMIIVMIMIRTQGGVHSGGSPAVHWWPSYLRQWVALP